VRGDGLGGQLRITREAHRGRQAIGSPGRMSITRPVDPERPAGPVDPLPPGSPVCKGRVVYRRQWRGRRDHTTFVGVWLSAAPGCRGLSYPARSTSLWERPLSSVLVPQGGGEHFAFMNNRRTC